MEKDFDLWNKNKKVIHSQVTHKLYHKQDVWWCSLGTNIGFEQDGAGITSERPVLIIRGFSKNVCLIVPLTTSKRKNDYRISIGNINGRESSAIISQIRLIDTKRLVNKIGFVKNEPFEVIRKAIRDLI